MGKWFAGSPFGNPKKNSGTENAKKNSGNPFRNPKKNAGFRNVKRFFSGRTTIFFRKRVAKDIDTTRVKRIELTNKDKIRSYLEREAHFPQESPSFLQVLRKTILDYFLPYPPAPPLDDKRKTLPDHREK